MRFRVRNTFYLRVSSSDVIPLYVYLDERHVDWMSERTLHSVVSDLKPLIGPKLEAERYAHYGPGGPASAKKGTVEVCRGDSYQFAYFLRKAEPHAIVVKTRNYVLVDRPAQPNNTTAEKQTGVTQSESNDGAQTAGSTKGKKRPRKSATTSKRGTKGKAKVVDVVEDSEEDIEELSSSQGEIITGQDDSVPTTPRRSTRSKKQRTAYREISDDDDLPSNNDALDNDVNMQAEEGLDVGEVQVKQETSDEDEALRDENVSDNEPEPEPALPPDFGMDEDEEEKKLKPQLQLSFRSLDMRDRCLCVVVEPWPAIQPLDLGADALRAASVAPSTQNAIPNRAQSVAASQFASESESQSVREQTPLPLFLPDPSGRDRSQTPMPIRFPSTMPSLETIDDTQDPFGDGDGFGMLAFSQALNNVSGDRIGAAEDDEDEMDGGALYGDADEIRGALL